MKINYPHHSERTNESDLKKKNRDVIKDLGRLFGEIIELETQEFHSAFSDRYVCVCIALFFQFKGECKIA